MSVRILVGDCREKMRELPDASVNCCVTSPPYFGLRDYGCEGQMGLEPTPDEFVAGMVEVFRDVRRGACRMMEMWLPAPGYEGRYEVSNLGRIRSLPRIETDRRGRNRSVKGGILKPSLDTGGYLHVSLRISGKLRLVKLHRLIALAFHGSNRNALHNEVAHLDGNAANARADNLKWVSKIENRSHQMAHGTNPCGSRHGNAKLNEAQVAMIKRLLLDGANRTATAEQFGVSRHCIESIHKGENWRRVAPLVSGGGAEGNRPDAGGTASTRACKASHNPNSTVSKAA